MKGTNRDERPKLSYLLFLLAIPAFMLAVSTGWLLGGYDIAEIRRAWCDQLPDSWRYR